MGLNNSTIGFSLRNNFIKIGITLHFINFSGEILYNTFIENGIYKSIQIDSPSITSFAAIKNNVFNNFFYYYEQNMGVNYNVLYSNTTGLRTSNKVNQAPSTIFVGNNASSLEGQYMLSAKGAGEGGVDCGAFGGDEPSVIGGVPSGPIIQELTVPQVTSGNTINVRVKARVQN